MTLVTSTNERIVRLRLDDLSWQQLDDEIVVLDLAGSSYLKVNGSGTVLWTALADGADHETLVTTLTERYGIDRARAAADVDAFLADLDDKDLLDHNT